MAELIEIAGTALAEQVLRAEPLQGGDLSQVCRLHLAGGGTAIAKTGPDPRAEADMLRAIAATGAPAPRVLAALPELLILEDLRETGQLTVPGWAALGRDLRRLHAATGAGYGWPTDYAFGKVRIANADAGDWPAFWAARRLRPFLPGLPTELAQPLEALCTALPDLLPAAPPPALLHGDLWTGNILMAGERVSGLIDPACYHGHAEVDLAMLCLFGAPPEAFWAAYGPLAQGWPRRRAIYQLWPALVHLALFGPGYAGLVRRLLSQSGA